MTARVASAALIVGLCGMLAGCSWTGSGAGSASGLASESAVAGALSRAGFRVRTGGEKGMPQPFMDYPNDGVNYAWIVYGQFGRNPTRQGLVEALAARSPAEAKTWEGMMRSRECATETAGFYNTVGFNDDTRAFFSIPARHDLARRIDCAYLAELVTTHRLDLDEAEDLAVDLAYRLPKAAYRL